MSRNSTMISVEGDRDYVDDIGILARQRKQTIASLVRAALDKEYGAALGDIKRFFHPDSVASIEQKVEMSNGSEEVVSEINS